MTCTCIVYRYNLKRAEQHCRIKSSLQLVIVTLHIRVRTTAGGAGGSGSGSTHAHTHTNTHTQTDAHMPGACLARSNNPTTPSNSRGNAVFFCITQQTPVWLFRSCFNTLCQQDVQRYFERKRTYTVHPQNAALRAASAPLCSSLREALLGPIEGTSLQVTAATP